MSTFPRLALYRPIAEISVGRASLVYRAEHLLDGASVVIKAFPRHANPEPAAQYVNELEFLTRLAHPNLIKLLDFGQSLDNGTDFLTLQPVIGTDFVRASKSVSRNGFIDLIRQLIRVLDYLQARDTVHGDLKPQNILVSQQTGKSNESNQVKLIDLSSACSQGRSGPWIEGTPHYIAPEVIRGHAPTAASDLYSLGAILYECLAGSPPYADLPVGDVLQQQLNTTPKPIQEHSFQGLHSLIFQLLANDPRRRPSSAQEFFRLFRLAVGEESLRLQSQDTWHAYCSTGPFIGEKVLNEFTETFASLFGRLTCSSPNLVILRGAPGAGKTRTLVELGVLAKRMRLRLLRLAQPAVAASYERMREATLATLADASSPLLITYDRRGAFSSVERQLISDLSRCFPSNAVLVLIVDPTSNCYEDDLAFAQTFSKASHTRVLSLTPMTATDISHYVAHSLAVRTVPPALVDCLERDSAGNPLLLTADLTYYLEKGRLTLIHRSMTFIQHHDSPDYPSSIEPYLDSLHDGLSSNDREIETLLAVALVPLDMYSISRLTHIPSDMTQISLQRLVRRGVICHCTGPTPDTYGIINELLRCAVRRHLSSATRGVLDAALARLFAEQLDSMDCMELAARHFSAAGFRNEAVQCSLRAALIAEREDAQDRAASLYRCALAQQVGGLQDRITMTLGLCRALMAMGSHGDAWKHIEELTRIQNMHENLKLKVLLLRAVCVGRMGSLTLWEQESRNALKLARSLGARIEQIEGLSELGAALCWQGKIDDGKRLLVKARVRAHKLGLLSLVSRVLRDLSYSLWIRGEYKTALAYARRRVHLAAKSPDDRDKARAYQSMSVLEFELGLYRRSRHRAVQSINIARSLTPPYECGTENNIGETYSTAGRLRQAKPFYCRALEEVKRTRQDLMALVIGTNLAILQIRAGFYEEGIAGMQSRLRYSRIQGSSQTTSVILGAWALLLSTTGRFAAARRLLAYSCSFAQEKGVRHAMLHNKVLMSQILAEEGRGDLARPLLVGALRTYGDQSPFDVRVEGQLLRIQLDQLIGKPLKEIESQIESIQSVCRAKGLDRHLCRCMMIRAQAMLSVNRGDESLQGLEEALRLARRNADRTLAWEISLLMGRVHEQGLRYERALTCYRVAALTVKEMAFDLTDERYRAAFLARPLVKEALERYDRMTGEVGRRARRDLATLNRSEMVSRKMLAALSDIGQKLATSLKLDELMERTLDLAIENVHAERGMIFLREETTGEMRLACARGLDRESLGQVESFSRTVVREVAEGRSLLTVDVGEDPILSGYQSLVLHEIKSILCVPMRSRGLVAGVIYLDTRRASQLFTDKERAFVESFAGQAAVAIENARLFGRMQDENSRLRRQVEGGTRFASLVGDSPPMRHLSRMISSLLDRDCNILIRGESGTGKEVVARALHHHGPRSGARFVAIDCGALPESLLESELFGYARGAFTGADRERRGLIEEAHGGTLFLDEITNTSTALQARLLRVLQEREVRRVGENRPRRVDVRVIAATNADLETLLRESRFRRDLYYRLNVVTLEVPPLRSRKEDIPLLTEHFLERRAGAGRSRKRLGAGVLEALMRHDWPGNVRELDNVIERLSILSAGNVITPEDLPPDLRPFASVGPGSNRNGMGRQKNGEQMMIEQALTRFGGDKTKAARYIGWNRQKLYRRMREYGIATDYGKAA